jgi:hypothetical protein
MPSSPWIIGPFLRDLLFLDGCEILCQRREHNRFLPPPGNDGVDGLNGKVVIAW